MTHCFRLSGLFSTCLSVCLSVVPRIDSVLFLRKACINIKMKLGKNKFVRTTYLIKFLLRIVFNYEIISLKKSQYMPIHSILILIIIAHYLFIYTVTHISNSRKFAKKWKYCKFFLFLHWEVESAGLLE